jgi:hypoxanthine phosphoribosyltransferase
MPGIDSMQLMFSADAIAARVRALAGEIMRDCAGRPIVLLVVMKGAMIFAADLMRHLSGEVFVDAYVVSSYAADGRQADIRVLYEPRVELAERHVVLVDEIVDTGVTIDALLRHHLHGRGAASVRVCALLDKAAARTVPVTLDYVGFPAPDRWLVGYGMDSDGTCRNLPEIYAMDRSAA